MGEKKILDWNEYVAIARAVVAEGCILLSNEICSDGTKVLPLREGEKVAVFGRIQNHYYKSGTGSGGMVNVSRVIGILDALKECGRVSLNQELLSIYEAWEEEHPFDEGEGWGNEPWSQMEMELSPEVVKQAAAVSEVAIVIIGRTAGEDMDETDTPGSYRLTEVEEAMLTQVREAFSKMVVLLNVGGSIDLSFMDAYRPEATMLVWAGGMVGGLGTVDVLLGDVSPSGHLSDSITYEIADHASDRNFGNPDKDYYQEDIYVGYRYLETFAPDTVRFPFGFGLSYTEFAIDRAELLCGGQSLGSLVKSDSAKEVCKLMNVPTLKVELLARNVGTGSGKMVPQIYVEAPQGKLGKPVKVLAGFAKTQVLASGEAEEISLDIPAGNYASFDDSGVTGYKNAFVLESGVYRVFAGENIRDVREIGSFELGETLLVEQLEEALAPVEAFSRIRPEPLPEGGFGEVMEEVPLSTIDMDMRCAKEAPADYGVEQATDEAMRLAAGMTDKELTCIIRGEGMGSSRVTPGTAAAFAGVSAELTDRVGLPAVCCSDGPSGMRLDCGMKAFSLPSGLMIASTFHPRLVQKLYSMTGLEMIASKVDCLLGPGMNIHRHPLNGRNFEYFSEDPLLTGKMAGAMVQGLQSSGVTGVIKHFCGNNQEYRRHFIDSVISQRALREIYLRGFEMVVKEYGADSVMTTYGAVNGLFTAGNYDLNTTILRKQWGFTGIVMTDWWASINERGKAFDKTNFSAMVRSQNDLYMVCPDGSRNASGDNIEEGLEKGWVTRGQLRRSAENIIRFALGTEAMKRKKGEGTIVEILNRPKEDQDVQLEDVEYMTLDGDLTIPLDTKESKGGTSYLLPFDISKPGTYEVTVVGSSKLGELAQLPCTLFYSSFPLFSYTFHGSNGAQMELSREAPLLQRFAVMRLYVSKNGLDLKEIRFHFLHEGGHMSFLEEDEKKTE